MATTYFYRPDNGQGEYLGTTINDVLRLAYGVAGLTALRPVTGLEWSWTHHSEWPAQAYKSNWVEAHDGKPLGVIYACDNLKSLEGMKS